MELKKIGVWSFAKITAIFGLVMGIVQIIFIIVLQIATANISLEQLGVSPVEFNLRLGVSSVLGIIILSIVIYFVAGVLLALIYNLIAKYIGGINLVLKESKKK